MKTRVDSEGRVEIPKEMRDEAGLTPGTEVEVRCRDGRIEVEAAPTIRLERQHGFLVAVADRPMPANAGELAEQVLEDIRSERGSILPEDGD